MDSIYNAYLQYCSKHSSGICLNQSNFDDVLIDCEKFNNIVGIHIVMNGTFNINLRLHRNHRQKESPCDI
jgi:hypothetical protein